MDSIRINPLKYPNIKCSCGCETYIQAFILKKIPGIVAGTGSEDQIINLPVFVCSKCGEILEDYKEIYKLDKYAEAEDAEEAEQTKSKSGLII